MNSDWFRALEERFEQELHSAFPGETSIKKGIWESVERGINLTFWRPQIAEGITVRELSDRQETYYVLKHNHKKLIYVYLLRNIACFNGWMESPV